MMHGQKNIKLGMNSVLNFILFYFTLHFNIILRPACRSLKSRLPFVWF
jgi:hypothetical protein